MDGEKKMSRIVCTLILTAALFLTSGCLHKRLVEGVVGNVGGWDVSACVTGFGTCWELFWDNSTRFEDGFVDALDSLGPQTGEK